MSLKRPPFKKGYAYHAYNRGFCKMKIFRDKKDIDSFNKKILKYSTKFDVTIESTALLPNHYHFILRQNGATGIKEFLTGLGLSYAMYFNKKYSRRGAVFEGRYQAILVDTDHYHKKLLSYILGNPIK
jgi:putative transposase